LEKGGGENPSHAIRSHGYPHEGSAWATGIRLTAKKWRVRKKTRHWKSTRPRRGLPLSFSILPGRKKGIIASSQKKSREGVPKENSTSTIGGDGGGKTLERVGRGRGEGGRRKGCLKELPHLNPGAILRRDKEEKKLSA